MSKTSDYGLNSSYRTVLEVWSVDQRPWEWFRSAYSSSSACSSVRCAKSVESNRGKKTHIDVKFVAWNSSKGMGPLKRLSFRRLHHGMRTDEKNGWEIGNDFSQCLKIGQLTDLLGYGSRQLVLAQ